MRKPGIENWFGINQSLERRGARVVCHHLMARISAATLTELTDTFLGEKAVERGSQM